MKPIGIAALVIVLIIPLIAVVLTQPVADSESTNQSTSNQEEVNTPSDPADAISAEEVILKTSKGDIRLTLYPQDAPQTVKNFVTLGKRGYYSNLIFHRVIKDFMIQGGDPTGTGSGGESIYGARFNDEINKNKIVAGTLAMANAGPNTNGSQFFIVTETAQPHLDGRHTAFGKVADGASMQVVRAIAAVAVDGEDRPVEPVTMTGFEVVK